MGNLTRTVIGVAIGAAGMYFFDPAFGRRRRALLRDRMIAMSHDSRDYARVAGKRTFNRLKGAAAETLAPLSKQLRPPTDRQIRDRVRTQLGRTVNRPRDVEVVVNAGYVSLRGQVSEDERQRLLAAVAAMPGVKQVDNRLAAVDEMPRTLARPDPAIPSEGRAASANDPLGGAGS